MRALAVVNLWLLCLAILALLVYIIPKPETCWLPPNASTRGIYESCWTADELWA